MATENKKELIESIMENFEDWLILPVIKEFDSVNTIDFPNLCKLVFKHNAFIAGGFARDLATNSNQAEDIDIFFTKQEDFDKLLEDFHGSPISYQGRVHRSSRAITFKKAYCGKDVQLIKPRGTELKKFDTPKKVLEDFDYTVCMFALVGENKVLTIRKAIYDYSNMFLRLQRVTNPYAAIMRAFKYAKKGYKINNLMLSHIFMAFENLTDEQKELILEKVIMLDVALGAKELYEILEL